MVDAGDYFRNARTRFELRSEIIAITSALAVSVSLDVLTSGAYNLVEFNGCAVWFAWAMTSKMHS
jgi:hypothetical protein